MADKPLAVQFGAGAIGRGFLGDLWTGGGFEVLFLDVAPDLVDRLNAQRNYPLRLTGQDKDRRIEPVKAALVTDTETIAEALVVCRFACTAVGVNAFSSLAPLLAAGIERRSRGNSGEPLNIICCENQKDAGAILRKAVGESLSEEAGIRAYFDSAVAFVDASVGRMVPPPTPELLAEDPLLVLAEPYAELPVDGLSWIGEKPPVPGLLLKGNFAGYVARKLFIHNGGHALLAYEGFQKGHEYIWQAAEDAELVAHLMGYWKEVGDALIKRWGFSEAEERQHEADLLQRFRNRELGDTVYRVGRDLQRKVRQDDRLVGAAYLCREAFPEQDVPEAVCRAIALAYAYNEPRDPTAPAVQQVIQIRGIAAALEEFSGISPADPLSERISAEYATIVSAHH